MIKVIDYDPSITRCDPPEKIRYDRTDFIADTEADITAMNSSNSKYLNYPAGSSVLCLGNGKWYLLNAECNEYLEFKEGGSSRTKANLHRSTLSENGSISVTIDGEPVDDGVNVLNVGDTVTVTVTADEGYQVKMITLNGEEIENGAEITIEGDISLIAEFEEAPAPSGTVLVPENVYTAEEVEDETYGVVEFTFIPDGGEPLYPEINISYYNYKQILTLFEDDTTDIDELKHTITVNDSTLTNQILKVSDSFGFCLGNESILDSTAEDTGEDWFLLFGTDLTLVTKNPGEINLGISYVFDAPSGTTFTTYVGADTYDSTVDKWYSLSTETFDFVEDTDVTEENFNDKMRFCKKSIVFTNSESPYSKSIGRDNAAACVWVMADDLFASATELTVSLDGNVYHSETLKDVPQTGGAYKYIGNAGGEGETGEWAVIFSQTPSGQGGFPEGYSLYMVAIHDAEFTVGTTYNDISVTLA